MLNLKFLRYLTTHPLNRRTRFRSIDKMLCWYVATRLLPGSEIIVPFVNNARIVVTPGRWGSEANALCGLHEFADMGFLLHFLRPTDLFCDVGANVGSYTILAAAAIGAKCIAFEPIESSYIQLRRNIEVNRVADLVDIRHMAVGRLPGNLTLTSGKDTMNHVIVDNTSSPITSKESVSVDSLDHALAQRVPLLLKVDVEGWEYEVLQGSMSTLHNPDLLAIIVELNKSGRRYGVSDETIHRLLMDNGFSAYRYKPFDRKLTELGNNYSTSGNTLYIRNPEFVSDRLRNAPPFTVRDFHI